TYPAGTALYEHLTHHKQKRNRLDELIETVQKSSRENRGEIKMTDQEKFEAFKKGLIQKNEEQYGEEIREKYGEDVIDQSNEKIYGMSKEDYAAFETLTKELNEKIAKATRSEERSVGKEYRYMS